jgi:C_GCAxxG_C_C family probable redox protein
MPDGQNKHSSQTERLTAQLKARAKNLYLTRQLLCAEAVLVTLNEGLNGGLSESQAISLAAPFTVALGDSGCICGALSGAVMACGLLLGGDRPCRRRREMRVCARHLHDEFKGAHGSTCCRILSRKVKDDKQAHFEYCADLTANATEMAARLILDRRPALIALADNNFLDQRDSKAAGLIKRLWWLLSPGH